MSYHPHTVSHGEQQSAMDDPCDICGIPRYAHGRREGFNHSVANPLPEMFAELTRERDALRVEVAELRGLVARASAVFKQIELAAMGDAKRIAELEDALVHCSSARIVELEQQLAEMKAEYASADEMCEALSAKVKSLSAHETCACSYDKPDDVCVHHSPQLAEAKAELAAKTQVVEMIQQRDRPMAKRIEESTTRINMLERELAEAKAVIAESNEVCVCGCPVEQHESYGEDGEGCGIDEHQCVRTCIAVRDMLAEAKAEYTESDQQALEARHIAQAVIEDRHKKTQRLIALEQRNAKLVEACEAAIPAIEALEGTPIEYRHGVVLGLALKQLRAALANPAEKE